MRLFLMQHGEAKSESEDPERPLTQNGIEDVEKMAEYMATHLEFSLCEVYHSGKMRARQTAEIVAGQLSRSIKVMMETDGLAPLDDPKLWAERLKKLNEDVILVGHLPHLSRLASLLITGDSHSQLVKFQYACVIGISLDQEKGCELELTLTPKII